VSDQFNTVVYSFFVCNIMLHGGGFNDIQTWLSMVLYIKLT